MGGLSQYTKITMYTLLTASLAIAGFPYLAGFYSKDAILSAAYDHAPWMFWVGVVTACMTAFYVFRAFFMTFLGEYKGATASAGHGHDKKGHDDHGHDNHGHGDPHESPPSMWIPLVVLAVLSIFGGYYFNIPKFLEPMFKTAEEGVDWSDWKLLVSVAAGFLGIGLAYVFYVLSPGLADSIVRAFAIPYRWVYNKYYVDELYDSAIVEPIVGGSRSLLWRVVDASGIDGLVNGVGKFARELGGIAKRAQSGQIRNYAAWVVLGAIIVIVTVSFSGGAR